MSKKTKQPVKQHYVPKFILKGFAKNPRAKRKMVFVYDKHSDIIFTANIRDVGCENKYYDFKIEDFKVTAEFGLARIENELAPIVSNIVSRQRIDDLTFEERGAISFFIAMQMTRSPTTREHCAWISQMFFDIAEELTGVRELEGEQEPSEEEIKANACMLIPECEEFAKLIFLKKWFLLTPPAGAVFHLSDTPVVLANDNDSPLRASLGLACKGIQIYMPLSKNIVLAMYCPTLTDKLENEAKELLAKMTLLSSFPRAGKVQAESVLAALSGESPLLCEDDHVTFINSLQTEWSRRYLYSSTNDFSLPKRMIEDHPEYKEGMKWKVHGFEKKS
ncbi:DUF4238 domain-containing protein [Halodesulfovibrio sp.]|jgi:hypothetical protein|uniref:DUF4238 domain-containing protein n=1 Tax=Halodesulfovibrio sp. TaxID=1912772 RepID=UPI0025E113D4|nr:DUF4238 domain-containing protein [Halodesulfovibrio sp.]MCT4628027.1 DUF4238 domain-containing protein [Halodesulfovibrio sp.]